MGFVHMKWIKNIVFLYCEKSKHSAISRRHVGVGKVHLKSMKVLRRHENSVTFSQHHLPTLGEEERDWLPSFLGMGPPEGTPDRAAAASGLKGPTGCTPGSRSS